jgi:PadR family transcriptional regulator, regulatory protein AphA
MSLRFALLGLLAECPRTGYELTKHFQQSLAYVWPARHGQIYPELARLREEGLIELVEEGPRRSKTYAATDAGVAQVRVWLRETEPERSIRNEAMLRVFFLWLLEPADAERYLRAELDAHRARLAEYEEMASEPRSDSSKEQAFRVALEAGIRSRRAAVEWAEWALLQAPLVGVDVEADVVPARARDG